MIEIFRNPSVVAQAKESFTEETKGVSYFSMLPPDQKPPLALNRATMERFRADMRAHYVGGRPRFV